MNVYDDKSFKFSKQQDPVGQNGALGAHVHDLVVEAAEAGAGGGFFSFSSFVSAGIAGRRVTPLDYLPLSVQETIRTQAHVERPRAKVSKYI